MPDLDRVYAHRFEDPDARAKGRLWVEIGRIEQHRVARSLLRPARQEVVLQPKIRLVGSACWDFIDHKVALTERSLVAAAETAGFQTERGVTRFLPYATKSRLRQHPLLVRSYLRVRLAWRLLRGQTLYIGRRT